MVNPKKNLMKESLSGLLGAGKERRQKRQTSSATKKWHRQLGLWRSSSLRAYDPDTKPSPWVSSPSASSSSSSSLQWRSQSWRNVETRWSFGEEGYGTRRATSDDDPSYVALEKLFDQFQGSNHRLAHVKKVVVSVSVLGSIGRLLLLIADNATVLQLIAMALTHYANERRLPRLGINVQAFHLCLTPFDPLPLPSEETIKQLGVRTFVLYPAKEINQSNICCKSSTKNISRGSRSWWRFITGGSS